MTSGPTLLALSTSSAALSVALFRGDELLAAHHEIIGRGHAEALVALVARLMGDSELVRVDRVIVDVGPGSFTGVRVGVAAARALGLGWAAGVGGVEAAALVAAPAFAADPGLAETIVSIDAGRGQHYRQQRFRDGSGGPIMIVTADGEPQTPDCRNTMLLLPATRALPPAPLYIRPPDAVLPL